MRFGKTLRNLTLKEWRFYSVDYKLLKQTLKGKHVACNNQAEESASCSVDEVEFFRILDESKEKLSKFYFDREAWAEEYIKVLEERVMKLRESSSRAIEDSPPSMTSTSSSDMNSSLDNDSESNDSICSDGEDEKKEENDFLISDGAGNTRPSGLVLKEEYRRVGRSEHFQNFIYAKKSLCTFVRELTLLMEFLDLNKTAFSKILKKFDKVTDSSIREERMSEILEENPFLEGEKLQQLKHRSEEMLREADILKPSLPEGWESRKVYTIGCFDLFHRGHQNVLMSLREFGYYIVAGIHDDESYFKLKNKYTIDNLETRMKNVKPYVDQLYVIPSTDPLLYIQSAVSPQDIETGSCCYARGDDMLNFPGREWVESVMPVHFVPRTEACSSTLLRTIYHGGDAKLRAKAAFAKTRYDGKPVDEEGNVLKLT